MQFGKALGTTAVLGLAAGLLIVAGCSGPDPRSGPPPAAFAPGDFPDIPIPPGYVPKAGEDQLAVSYGDGAVRRYHVVLQQANEDVPLVDEELESWVRTRYGARGWRLEEDRWPKRQRWLRSDGPAGPEQLLVETGRADRRTIIRLVVTPASG